MEAHVKRLAFLGALALLTTPLAAQVRLNGAGATFPNIIYQNWMLTYNQKFDNVELNYQSIGSGGGIRQFSDRTVDFGGTDAPMTDSAIAAIQGNVLHLPTVLGAVVPTYNLPGVATALKFTPEILADIFLGKITKWNDPKIAAENAGVSLPATDVIVVHRSDGSGTTFVWVDYLTKVSPEWSQKVGRGTSVNWPVGLGGRGNEGVADGAPDAGRRRLRGAGLRVDQQDVVRPGEKPLGLLHHAEHRVGDGSRGRRHVPNGPDDRLPRVDHRSGRHRRVSHRELHLAARPEELPGRR
jgi:hypothetical protein